MHRKITFVSLSCGRRGNLIFTVTHKTNWNVWYLLDIVAGIYRHLADAFQLFFQWFFCFRIPYQYGENGSLIIWRDFIRCHNWLIDIYSRGIPYESNDFIEWGASLWIEKSIFQLGTISAIEMNAAHHAVPKCNQKKLKNIYYFYFHSKMGYRDY